MYNVECVMNKMATTYRTVNTMIVLLIVEVLRCGHICYFDSQLLVAIVGGKSPVC